MRPELERALRLCRDDRWSLPAIASDVALQTELGYSDVMEALHAALAVCVVAMLEEETRR